jgi:carbonic anhydrase/acetyltransferase-like protein (isoleucine patch superfamily)
VNPEQPFPLLPDSMLRPSRWTSLLRRRGARSGVDLSVVTFGAGRPLPLINNEAGTMRLGRIFLAAGSRLWSHKGGELAIDDGAILDAGAEVIAWERVTIGKNCYLGWDALVLDTDLHRIGGCPLVNKPVTIGDNVYIGCRAIILKGVTIGNGALIHPGSIVTRDVPAGAVVRPPEAAIKGMLPHERVQVTQSLGKA